MKALINKHFIILLLLITANIFNTHSQEITDPDELFKKARNAAFTLKDYDLAISIARKALKGSPNYADIRIFVGRIYTWTDKPDSARMELQTVLKQKPDYEDALMAITDLEYWNDNYEKALEYCYQGLGYHPDSRELILKKIKILKAKGDYVDAYNTANELLIKNPADATIRVLLDDIKEASALNKIGIGYNLVWFDKGYPSRTPWQITSLDYTRMTKIGSVTARWNYGKRFGNTASQFEVDAYPHLAKGLYAYTNVGISDKQAVFPRFRAGLSLYKSLPYSAEAELGARYLHFSSNTWIYVGGLSRYYKSFWFYGRVIVVPGDNSYSRSLSLITRYFVRGADDYFHLGVNYGFSPDEANSVSAYNNLYDLKSKSITVGYKRSIARMNIISISASLQNQEYYSRSKKTITSGNQLDMSISYQRRF